MSGSLRDTEVSFTVTGVKGHPVRDFLQKAGLNVTSFPHFTFLIETDQRDLRTYRVYVPLRLPEKPGWVYASYCRIRRIFEVPAVKVGQHRKFIEIEWQIDEEAILEEDTHSAFSFIAGELHCLNCREFFIPDPELLNKTSIRVNCPNCLHHWIIKVEASSKTSEPIELLLDTYQSDPKRFHRQIKEWASQPLDASYYSYFPFQFVPWDEGTSFQWLFETSQGWSAISNGTSHGFEVLCKSLLNQFTLQSFQASPQVKSHDELEKTEVQRKTDVRKRESAQIKAIEQAVAPVVDEERSYPPQAPPKTFVQSLSFNRFQPSFQKPSEFFGKFLTAITGIAAVAFIGVILYQNLDSDTRKQAALIDGRDLKDELLIQKKRFTDKQFRKKPVKKKRPTKVISQKISRETR